jgi:hypothetical protein
VPFLRSANVYGTAGLVFVHGHKEAFETDTNILICREFKVRFASGSPARGISPSQPHTGFEPLYGRRQALSSKLL